MSEIKENYILFFIFNNFLTNTFQNKDTTLWQKADRIKDKQGTEDIIITDTNSPKCSVFVTEAKAEAC